MQVLSGRSSLWSQSSQVSTGGFDESFNDVLVYVCLPPVLEQLYVQKRVPREIAEKYSSAIKIEK